MTQVTARREKESVFNDAELAHELTKFSAWIAGNWKGMDDHLDLLNEAALRLARP